MEIRVMVKVFELEDMGNEFQFQVVVVGGDYVDKIT